MIKIVDGDPVKVLSWFDNEWGFTHQLMREITVLETLIQRNNIGYWRASRGVLAKQDIIDAEVCH